MENIQRPEGLDWDFLERFYPDYYHSDEILMSDDMSFCLDDLADDCLKWYDTVINDENHQAFVGLWEEYAYRAKNGFDEFFGDGLTYYQTQTLYDDELYAEAVLNASSDAVTPDTVRWAEKVWNTPYKDKKAWYTHLKRLPD